MTVSVAVMGVYVNYWSKSKLKKCTATHMIHVFLIQLFNNNKLRMVYQAK